MLRVVLLSGLCGVLFVAPALAQREIGSRELTPQIFLVNVNQVAMQASLGPDEHLLTFHNPIEVPGATLVAGTYLFRRVGPSVLQIVAPDRSHVYTAFMTLRADGDGDTTKERIKLQQFGEDGPLRILAWYPAYSVGYEFIYPKPKRQSVDRR